MSRKNIFITINNKKETEVKEGIKYENKDFCIISNQELYDLNQEKLELEKVIELYKNKIELANVISNMFTIIIIDKNKSNVICIQDINGDSISMYYYKEDDKIIISNKMLNIINYYKDNRFLINKNAIGFFLKKGFIPNKETLVKNIYKLVPKYNLKINLENKREKLIKKRINYTKIKNYTDEMYIQEFKKIIDNNSKDKRLFATLSNGYDSNFIYSFLDKNMPIEAFSVGGIAGRDETIQVKNNIKNYKNTNLNIAYVSEKTLENYLDLVYLLEGAVYEIGIFLQYELANTVKDKKVDNAILFEGEGADQVFSTEYYNKIVYLKQVIKCIGKVVLNLFICDETRNLHIRGGMINRKDKYKMLSYVITKKNGILMNEIGINYVYPYLSRNIINMGYLNRYNNLFCNKKSHKKACKKVINPNIMKNIIKIGGATDISAMFKNCSYIKDIEDVVSKSKFNILKIKKDFSSINYSEYLLKVLYLEIFEYLFIENTSNIDNDKQLKLSQFLKKKSSK